MPETVMSLDTVLSVCLGLGLAAACGFRIFVPLLVMSVASLTGHLELSGQFEWISTVPAAITLSVATVLEVGAYYIPWLDNLLDTVASPIAVVAGVVVSASVITGMDPYLKWTLAVIAGGGVAGAVQMLTSGTRGVSTLTTAGFGNPLVSTAEVGGSLVTAILSVVAPILTVILVAIFLILVVFRFGRRGRDPVPASYR
jgi:hypothetical protein